MLDSLRLRYGHYMPGALDCPDMSPSNPAPPTLGLLMPQYGSRVSTNYMLRMVLGLPIRL